MNRKELALVLLSSVGIFLVGMLIFSIVMTLALPSDNFRLFRRYTPGVCTMVVLTLYLIKKAGTQRLVFSAGLKSVKSAIFGIIASFIYSIISNHLYFNPVRQEIGALNGYNYIVILLIVGMLTPIFEEIVVRGYVFENARCNYGLAFAWCANITVSIVPHYIFALYKISIPHVIYMIIGVAIITISYQYGRLYASIVVHGFINIYGFVIR